MKCATLDAVAPHACRRLEFLSQNQRLRIASERVRWTQKATAEFNANNFVRSKARLETFAFFSQTVVLDNPNP